MSSDSLTVSQPAGYLLALPWVAMLLGVALVLIGIQRYAPSPLGADEAARVNARSISLEDWQRAIDAANAERKTPLDAAGERALLDILVDQELLLQLAIELDLVHSLPAIRGQLVRAAMDTLSQRELRAAPDAVELERFVNAHPALFAQPERVAVRAWRHPTRAAALAADAGEPVVMPASLQTAQQLQRWLGASLTTAILEHADTGALPSPIAVGQGWYRVEILQREAAHPARAADLPRAVIEREWQRQQGEAALAQALGALRSEADLHIRNAR